MEEVEDLGHTQVCSARKMADPFVAMVLALGMAGWELDSRKTALTARAIGVKEYSSGLDCSAEIFDVVVSMLTLG